MNTSPNEEPGLQSISLFISRKMTLGIFLCFLFFPQRMRRVFRMLRVLLASERTVNRPDRWFYRIDWIFFRIEHGCRLSHWNRFDNRRGLTNADRLDWR